MKLHSLFAIALLAVLMACEKDDPAPPNTDDPVVVQNQVTEDLAGQDNLSQFVEAFNALEMSSNDIAEGITIFAPVDNAFNNSNGRSASDTLTSTVLKDHIVKGVLEAVGLNDGDTLITLNGKQLTVTIDGEDVRVNGVLISGKNVATTEKYVVHTVEQIISNTVAQDGSGTIEVTVWNGAKWSPENPKGEIEAGVTVSLYNSRADLMQGKAAAHTAETGAGGKATFTNIAADKIYYIAATKEVVNGTLGNAFYRQEQDTVYVGMVPDGIFQSQEEVNSNPVMQQDAMLGNFRWKDINADGLINESDKVALPHQEVGAINSQTIQIEVAIGYSDNRSMNPSIQNEEEALQMLQTVYENLVPLQADFIMIDGILSNDTDECYSLCALDNFTVAANDFTITKLWQDAYRNIAYLNLLLRDVPKLSFTEKDNIVAEATGLRAFIYLKLVTYFGDIPQHLQTGFELEDNTTRMPAEDIYAFIEESLQQAKANLPAQWPSSEIHRFSSHAASALLAKVALQQAKWQEVVMYTEEIFQSGRYIYMDNNTLVFDSYENTETIWNNFAVSTPNAMFMDYFFKFSRSHYPTVRLTELYLMNVEAQLESGNLGDTFTNLNTIRSRNGMPTVADTSTPEQVREALRTTWTTVMSREGNSFANLVRWGIAEENLMPKGYQPHHAVLPLPQVFIDKYPNLLQNPGY